MLIYISKFFIWYFIIGTIIVIIGMDILNDVDPNRKSYILTFIRKLKRK